MLQLIANLHPLGGDAAARTPERQHPRGRSLVHRVPCGARGTRDVFSGMRLNFPSLDLIYLDASLSTPYPAQMASLINGDSERP